MISTHTTDTFIETPQGIFIQHAGWLRITSEYLQKNYPEIWTDSSKATFLSNLNEWSLAFGLFPAFIGIILMLFMPFYVALPIACLVLMVVITHYKLLYGFRLTPVITLFNKPIIQIVVALAAFTFFGIRNEYVELGCGVILFFSARVGWIQQGSLWIGDTILKQEFLFEQFLQWMCMQESIKMGYHVPELQEMEQRLQKAIAQSKRK